MSEQQQQQQQQIINNNNKTVSTNNNKTVSTNYLSSGQKRLYKRLVNKGTILEAANDPDLFVSYSSWEQMKKEGKLNKSLQYFNKLVEELVKEVETTTDKNPVYSIVLDMCSSINLLVNGTECALLKNSSKEFVESLDSIFNIVVKKSGQNILSGNKIGACGVYNNLYRKVVAMMKNLNPFSRKTKSRSRKALTNHQAGQGSELTTVRAKNYSKSERTTEWIEEHLDYSLLLCCIDKVCYIIRESDVTAKVNDFMKGLAIHLDQFIPVCGGSVLSFLSSLRFYKGQVGGSDADGSHKVKLVLRRGDEGNFYFDCIIEVTELNTYNEKYRANSSTTDGKIPYQVYIFEEKTNIFTTLGDAKKN